MDNQVTITMSGTESDDTHVGISNPKTPEANQQQENPHNDEDDEPIEPVTAPEEQNDENTELDTENAPEEIVVEDNVDGSAIKNQDTGEETEQEQKEGEMDVDNSNGAETQDLSQEEAGADNQDPPPAADAELRLQLPQTARTDQVGTERTDDEGYDESVVIPTGDDSTYRTEGGPAPASQVEETQREPESAGMFTASDDGETARDMPQSEQPTERKSELPGEENAVDESARTENNDVDEGQDGAEGPDLAEPESNDTAKSDEHDNTNAGGENAKSGDDNIGDDNKREESESQANNSEGNTDKNEAETNEKPSETGLTEDQ